MTRVVFIQTLTSSSKKKEVLRSGNHDNRLKEKEGNDKRQIQ